MDRSRIALGATGMALVGVGVIILILRVPLRSLVLLAVWLLAALIIHDAVLAPLVVVIGLAVACWPPRARRFLQSALIVIACVLVIGVPLIGRQGRQPAATTVLTTDVRPAVGLLVGLVVAISVVRYVGRVVSDRRR